MDLLNSKFEGKKAAVFDVETDNLYQDVTKVHCLVIIDPFTNEVWSYRPHEIKDGIEKLKSFDILIGHNIIDYDLSVLTKLYGTDFTGMLVNDTLIGSRTYNPDRFGGHSLEAWGRRLKIYKGDFGKQDSAWDVFTEEMLLYCIQDVKVNVSLFHHLATEELGGYFCVEY